MTSHARKPAIITLTAAIAIAAVTLAATGQFRAAAAPTSLEQFEKAIAGGTADAATWNAYGDALRANRRFVHAAAAYERSLELNPDCPAARFNEALSLGQAGAPDKFFAYFARLTANDPKQAVDLLDRPELTPMHSDPQWQPAAAAAQGAGGGLTNKIQPSTPKNPSDNLQQKPDTASGLSCLRW